LNISVDCLDAWSGRLSSSTRFLLQVPSDKSQKVPMALLSPHLGKRLLLVPFGEGAGGATHSNSSTTSLEPPRKKQQWPVAPSKPMVTHTLGCPLQAGQLLQAARSISMWCERQRLPGPSPGYSNPHPNVFPQACPHFEGCQPTGTKLPLIDSPHNPHLLCS